MPRSFGELERVWNDMRRPYGKLEGLREPLQELRELAEDADLEARVHELSNLLDVGLKQIQLGLDQTEQILKGAKDKGKVDIRRVCDVLVGTVEQYARHVHAAHHTVSRTLDGGGGGQQLMEDMERSVTREFVALSGLAGVPIRFATLCDDAVEAYKATQADSPEAFERFIHGAREVMRRDRTASVTVGRFQSAIEGYGRARAARLKEDLRHRVFPLPEREAADKATAIDEADFPEAEELARRIVDFDPNIVATPRRIWVREDYVAARRAMLRETFLAGLGAPGLAALAAVLYLLGLLVLFRPSGEFEVQADDTRVLAHPREDADSLATLDKGWVLQCVRSELGHCGYRCTTDGAWFHIDLGERGRGWLSGSALRGRAAAGRARAVGALEKRCAQEESDREYGRLVARAKTAIEEEQLDAAWEHLSKAVALPAVSDSSEAGELRQLIAKRREVRDVAAQIRKGLEEEDCLLVIRAATRTGEPAVQFAAAMQGIRCRTESYLKDLQRAPTSFVAFQRTVKLEAEANPSLLAEDARKRRSRELKRRDNRRRYEGRYVGFGVATMSSVEESGIPPEVTVRLVAQPRSKAYRGPPQSSLRWSWRPESASYVLSAPLKESQDG